MLSAMLVLAVQQTDEFRMGAVILPGEANQLLHRLGRWGGGESELLLGMPELLIGRLKHGAEQLLFAVEVVVEHAIHGVRAPADTLDASAAESMVCKFFGGRLEDLALHAFRVATAARPRRRGFAAWARARLDRRRHAQRSSRCSLSGTSFHSSASGGASFFTVIEGSVRESSALSSMNCS